MTKTSYHHGDLAAALLGAAEEELIEKGADRFSMRSVAKRAGVSHGAPAHHFGDARGLLTALAAKGYERLLAVQTGREETAPADPRARSLASGLGYLDFAVKNPELFRIMFNSSIPDRSDDRFLNVSLGVFNRLVQNSEALNMRNPYTDPEGMVDLMASWAIVHGLAELIISGRAERTLGISELSASERDKVLTAIIARAIKPS